MQPISMSIRDREVAAEPTSLSLQLNTVETSVERCQAMHQPSDALSNAVGWFIEL